MKRGRNAVNHGVFSFFFPGAEEGGACPTAKKIFRRAPVCVPRRGRGRRPAAQFHRGWNHVFTSGAGNTTHLGHQKLLRDRQMFPSAVELSYCSQMAQDRGGGRFLRPGCLTSEASTRLFPNEGRRSFLSFSASSWRVDEPFVKGGNPESDEQAFEGKWS